MRVTEIVLGLVVLLALIARVTPKRFSPRAASLLAYGAVLLVLVHLLVNGLRGQMIPLMAFAVVLGVLSLARKRRNRGPAVHRFPPWIRIPLLLLLFILYLGSIVFPVLLPLVDLPEPQGPYPVGRMCYRITDQNREEIFTADPGDVRQLLVTAWYPAELPKRSRRGYYWDSKGITGKIYSRNSGMGSFWYSHLSKVRTNSIAGAPLSPLEKSYPIILYSPSYFGLNTENTMLMESFASQGYIVFSMAHTYECAVSVFPDDQFIPGDLEHLSQLYDSHTDQERQLYDEYKNASSVPEKVRITERILAVDELSLQLLKQRTRDAISVLDELERWNRSNEKWKSRLDLSRVGIVGWSFGGATAMEACMADPRFKAGVNLDGTPYGPLFNSGKEINQPFMLLRSESGDEMEDVIADLIYARMKNDAYVIRIRQAQHGNFCDFPLFFKIYSSLGYWGTIDPERLLKIEDTYVLGFFNRYLKGLEVQALKEFTGQEGSSPPGFPELNLRGRETMQVH